MVQFLDILMILQVKAFLKIRKSYSFNDAKDSAFLILSFVLSQLLLLILMLYSILVSESFGVFIENYFAELWIASMVVSPLMLYFRYYRRLNNDELAKKYEKLKPKKQIFKVAILSFIIIVPVACFTLYRYMVT